MTKPLNIAYVKANWHAPIVNQTQVGFEAELKDAGREYELTEVVVPGALEMPMVAKKLAQ